MRLKQCHLAFTIIGIAFLASVLLLHQNAIAQSVQGMLTGYAWSETIGWISLSGPTYGLAIAQNGDVSGYAWSENIGWISAQTADLVGCPQNPCRAKLAGNRLTGWLKALAGGTSESGGWDGWISLSGTSPTYGPVLNTQTGRFSGFAWGDTVVGWVDFSFASTNANVCPQMHTYSCSGNTIQYTNDNCELEDVRQCVEPEFCSPGSSVCISPAMRFGAFGSFDGRLTARPSIVPPGGTARLYWNVENAENCTVTENNTLINDSWNLAFSGPSGVVTSPITQATTYTLYCTAPDGVSPPELIDQETINIVPTFREK